MNRINIVFSLCNPKVHIGVLIILSVSILIRLFLGFHIDDTNRYICNKCSNAYKYRRTIVRHLNYECGKQRNFHCHCGKTFKRKDHLKQHVIVQHSVKYNWNILYHILILCVIGNKTFKAFDLLRHFVEIIVPKFRYCEQYFTGNELE